MLSFGILTVVLDFAILLLPVPLVMSLQLSAKQRIAVCTLFGMGFVVCIAGIVQVYYVDFALKNSYDETWDGWPLWVASAVQVDVGIVSQLSFFPFPRDCPCCFEPARYVQYLRPGRSKHHHHHLNIINNNNQ